LSPFIIGDNEGHAVARAPFPPFINGGPPWHSQRCLIRVTAWHPLALPSPFAPSGDGPRRRRPPRPPSRFLTSSTFMCGSAPQGLGGAVHHPRSLSVSFRRGHPFN